MGSKENRSQIHRQQTLEHWQTVYTSVRRREGKNRAIELAERNIATLKRNAKKSGEERGITYLRAIGIAMSCHQQLLRALRKQVDSCIMGGQEGKSSIERSGYIFPFLSESLLLTHHERVQPPLGL